MKSIRYPAVVFAVIGVLALLSCNEGGGQAVERVSDSDAVAIGKEIVDSQCQAEEALVDWLEQIKDADTAKLAMSSFDKVQARFADYQGLAEKYGDLEFTLGDAAVVRNYQEEITADLQGRIEKAQSAAV